jgi:hypothetical protein
MSFHREISCDPAIFVINLVYRCDRREEMQRELAVIGWRAEFFPAVRAESAAGFPSTGARGCFLSHLAVLRKARDAGVENVVLLEDDVNFVADFGAQWRAAMVELARRDWSLFYAGHALKRLPAGLSRLAPGDAVRCSHFLVVNRKALTPLIEGLEMILSRPPGHPLGGPMHVDGAYSTIRAQNRSVISYVCSPVLGYQRPSRSDVDDLRWFDRLSLVSPLVKIARHLKARR